MFKGRTLPLMLVVIMCLDFDLTQEMECPNFLFLAPRPSNNPYFNYLNVLFSIWRVRSQQWTGVTRHSKQEGGVNSIFNTKTFYFLWEFRGNASRGNKSMKNEVVKDSGRRIEKFTFFRIHWCKGQGQVQRTEDNNNFIVILLILIIIDKWKWR